MDPLENLFLTQFGGQELWRYGVLVLAILIAIVIGKLAQWILLQMESSAKARDAKVTAKLFHAGAAAVLAIAALFGIKAGLLFLSFPQRVTDALTSGLGVLHVLAFGWLCFHLTEAPTALYKRWSDKQASKLTQALTPILRTSLQVIVVTLTVVQAVQVLSDKPVTSILAGLGIGGLAFALAAQDSLKHFFGSVVIFTDRPFEVGDRLVIDGHDGPVEEVGFRSTKIRTLEGHLVTIPNGELVNKNILNISKRPHIRRIMNLSITYDTPPAKVEEAVNIVEDILKDHEGMAADFPPRVYFNDLKSDSLNLLVIYWYHPPAYWDFLAFGQRVNLEIMRRFEAAGIDFAFPTQTLHLAGDPHRPLQIGLETIPDLPGGNA